MYVDIVISNVFNLNKHFLFYFYFSYCPHLLLIPVQGGTIGVWVTTGSQLSVMAVKYVGHFSL